MCVYFSFIMQPGVVIRWCESVSHEETIYRLGLSDPLNRNRSFLRGECEGGLIDNFRIDESLDQLPSWYSDHETEYRDKIASILKKVNPINAKLDALDAYHYAKRDALYADYYAKRDALDYDHYAKRDALYDDQAKRAGVKADHKAKLDALYDGFKAKRDALYADHKAKRDALVKKLSRIVGYAPSK